MKIQPSDVLLTTGMIIVAINAGIGAALGVLMVALACDMAIVERGGK
jgi:ABC-type multidrug transport system permease subunit